MANVKTIIETARKSRNERGIAYLAAKDVAVLIRAALKKAFPVVKFSVRSD
ncbi:MAG: LPD29 domain-containing protein, partial [Planctomyces sp.]